ncbi:hypothetical protein [Spirosoma rhododendri]|uniref:Uncharacterized protein n=1 Tax=Spirosoma rhododendri TaxID=2728024 RepID=A0A7L5DL69_9BACT|nr:hypothetical protein [Spirosoma rhododendri]QJD77168.1 hypothetical protein HH216_01095 [Spirosoma rhododendri]
MKTVLICVVVTGLVLAYWQYEHSSISTTTHTDPSLTAAPQLSNYQSGGTYQPNLRGSGSSSAPLVQ